MADKPRKPGSKAEQNRVLGNRAIKEIKLGSTYQKDTTLSSGNSIGSRRAKEMIREADRAKSSGDRGKAMAQAAKKKIAPKKKG